MVHKEFLPVLELHLGDTGSLTSDRKWSEYQVDELECFGDNLFDSTVTFTQADGALEFPTFQVRSGLSCFIDMVLIESILLPSYILLTMLCSW